MRQALSEAAVRVALERYSKAHNAGIGAATADGPTAEQVAALHEELSAVLNEELTAALATATASSPEPAAVPPAGEDAEVERMLTLAAESEQAGQLRRAEALHQVG